MPDTEPEYRYNGYGRPRGSRNKRTKELFDRLEARGDIDPADFLSALISNEEEPKELRIQASGLLLPYKHAKVASVPAARFVEDHVVVPDFPTIESAEDYLKTIPVLLGRGEMDSQTALELSTLVRNWILSVHARSELELKKISIDGPGEQTIRIEGGMGRLPGTDIIMPVLDHGPVTNGHALEPPRPETRQTESVPPASPADESVTPNDSTNGQGQE
jgi:hypothetical protein